MFVNKNKIYKKKRKKKKIAVFGLKIPEKFFDALYFGAQPPTLY